MSADPMSAAVRELINARSLLVVTGAGISAESGVPTFRGKGGLWRGYDATQLATPAAFARDPDLVWEWYRWRRELCHVSTPNPAHETLVEFERSYPRFLLATQNVDGLHARAGSKAVVQLHGTIDELLCRGCFRTSKHTEDPFEPPNSLPTCQYCGAIARPHILWFGESYWEGVLQKVASFAQIADVCLVIGTSGQVWPPIALALEAKQKGATLIEINPVKSEITPKTDLWLQGPAGSILPELWRRMCV
jgi:NAD-dependent deacetylase